jgi:ribosomal-protein-alanine N-acetyltransferase
VTTTRTATRAGRRSSTRSVSHGGQRLLPLTLAHIDEVTRIEQMSYAFPWSRGNFVDSLASGYWMQVLCDADRGLVAYIVATPGVDEMHLLNITVAPHMRRRGLASQLIDTLLAECRRRDAATLWLEVRTGNHDALALYAARGFTERGRRGRYYPAPHGAREDAVVMALDVGSTPIGTTGNEN